MSSTIYKIIGNLPINNGINPIVCDELPVRTKLKSSMSTHMIGIAYHEDYNKYDLGTRHPLVGDKPKKTMEYFKEKKLMKYFEIFTPGEATEEDLLKVHSKDYVELVKSLSETGGMLAKDTPAPKGIFKYASLATGGTILAGEKLFDGFNCTLNPLGGFHHACRVFSSGFCFFNDIAIAIEYLREKYDLERFLVVDLDVHHGNGTQEIFYRDPTVLSLSFHQDGRTLYPGTGFIEKIGRDNGEGYTVNLPLPPGTGNESYLYAFDEIVPPITAQFDPQVIIYQSGVDSHHSDPLADLDLTYPVFYKLGKRMKKLSEEHCNKLLVAFGGGYNGSSCIISYYNIVCRLLNKAEYATEKKIKDTKLKIVQDNVSKLKDSLSGHWNF